MVRPPASLSALSGFERFHQATLPPDFRVYLSICDGMEEGELDEDLFSFWSIERLKPIAADPMSAREQAAFETLAGEGQFFWFADWSIYGHIWCIDFAPVPLRDRVVRVGDSLRLFPSFREFIEAYLEDGVAVAH